MTFSFLRWLCQRHEIGEHQIWEISHSLLNMSITAAYVILAVIAIRFLLKKAPKKFSYLLWIVVAFRLICPLSLELEFSLMSAIDAPVSESGVVEFAPSSMIGNPYPEITLPVTTVDEVINEQLPTGLRQTIGDELETANAIAVMVWTFGIDVMLLYAVYSTLKLRAALRTAVHDHDAVWVWGGARSPFILGIFRPRIYLPYGLTEEELDYVLRHERCHIRRGDHIVKVLAFLLLTIHWFNPFVWLAFVLMGRDMEMSCDEEVLRECGNIRKSYSTTLLSFAAGRRFPSPSPLAFGESSVKQRIKNVLRWKQPKVWVTALALSLCVAAVIFCAANPAGQEKPASPFGKTWEAAERLYDAPDSHHITQVEQAPYFSLTADERLLTRERIADPEAWRPWGNFTSVTLTKNTFDNYFRSTDNWTGGNAARFRRNNLHTWQLLTASPELSWYILQQKDGGLYAVGFYWDGGEAGRGADDDSAVRVVYRLEEAEMTTAPTAMLLRDIPYVTERCLYINPLSSAWIPHDTALTYTARETHLEIRNRMNGEVVQIVNMEHDWQWQALPYDAESWAALWFAPVGEKPFAPVDFDTYAGEKIWLPVSDKFALLQLPHDNALVLVEFFAGGDGTPYIWSLHILVPETAQPSAKWLMPPLYQSARRPVLELIPDFPHESITVSCTTGRVINYGDDGKLKEDGTWVQFLPGETISWAPLPGDGIGLMAMVERLDIYVDGVDGKAHQASLYLSGVRENDEADGAIFYLGFLSSATGLTLMQEADGVFLRELNTSFVSPPEGELSAGEDSSAVLVDSRALALTSYEGGLPVSLMPFTISESGGYWEAYLEHPAADGGSEWDLMFRAKVEGSTYDVIEIGVASSAYPLLSGIRVGDGTGAIAAAYGADITREEGLQVDRATGTSDERYRYEAEGSCVTFYLHKDSIYLITLEKLPADG